MKRNVVILPKEERGKDPLAPWDNAFFITINTGTTIPELKEALNTVWNYIMKHANEFLVGRPGGRLLEVKEHHRVEVGKKYHKVHLHGSAVFRTTGIAFLDYYKVNTFINDNLRQIKGFKRCNFQAKLVKNYNQSRLIAEYIDKDKSSDEESDE